MDKGNFNITASVMQSRTLSNVFLNLERMLARCTIAANFNILRGQILNKMITTNSEIKVLTIYNS